MNMYIHQRRLSATHALLWRRHLLCSIVFSIGAVAAVFGLPDDATTPSTTVTTPQPHHVFDDSSVCSGEAGWNYAALRCYRLFTYDFVYSDRTWTTAQNQCRTHGGKLVSVNSANEAYVLSNFLKSSGDRLYVWIGLTDHEREGQFKWVDGSNLTYTAWDAAEPTSGPGVYNIDAHVQDYVISHSDTWRDVPNDWTALIDGVFQPSGFVCEKEADMSWRWRLHKVGHLYQHATEATTTVQATGSSVDNEYKEYNESVSNTTTGVTTSDSSHSTGLPISSDVTTARTTMALTESFNASTTAAAAGQPHASSSSIQSVNSSQQLSSEHTTVVTASPSSASTTGVSTPSSTTSSIVASRETTTSADTRMWKPTAVVDIEPSMRTTSLSHPDDIVTVSSNHDTVSRFLPGPSTALYRFYFKPKTPNWLNYEQQATTETHANSATPTQIAEVKSTTLLHHYQTTTRPTSLSTTPEADDFGSTALKPISTTQISPSPSAVVSSTAPRQADIASLNSTAVSTTGTPRQADVISQNMAVTVTSNTGIADMTTSWESADLDTTQSRNDAMQQANDTIFVNGLSRLFNQLGINITASLADNLLRRFVSRLLTSDSSLGQLFRGPPGPRGERGPTGERGPAGPRGPPGAPGVLLYGTPETSTMPSAHLDGRSDSSADVSSSKPGSPTHDNGSGAGAGLLRFNASSVVSWIINLAGGQLPPGLAGAAGNSKPLALPLSSRLNSEVDFDMESHSKSLHSLQEAVSTGRKVIVVHTIAIAVIFALLLGIISYVRHRRRPTYGNVVRDKNGEMTGVIDEQLKTISTDVNATMKHNDKRENGLLPVDWSHLKDVKLTRNNL